MTQTTLVTSEKEFYELLTHLDTEVTNIIFPNYDVAWVSWKYSKDKVAAGKNVNMAVAAYVTQTRLKLYQYQRQCVLYWDTDSVIYIQKIDEAPKVPHR